MFEPSAGGRKNWCPSDSGGHHIWGSSYDVSKAVEALRELAFASWLWAWNVYKEQLLPITGSSEKNHHFQDFDKLKNVDVKKKNGP